MLKFDQINFPAVNLKGKQNIFLEKNYIMLRGGDIKCKEFDIIFVILIVD